MTAADSMDRTMEHAPTMSDARPAPEADRVRWPRLLPWLVLLLAALVYANTLNNDFIFDDTAWVTAGRVGPEAEPWTGAFGTRRPMLVWTLALNWALEGDQPRGYHLFNLIVHALAAVTLYGLVRRAVASRVGERSAPWLAFAVALLWAVHPLNTQAVTYVVQRGESLMGLFYLLTLYCLTRFATSEKVGWAVGCIAACFLGMASKEVMATAPIVAFFFDRAFLGGDFATVLRKRWWLYLGLAATWGSFLLFGGVSDLAAEGGSAGFALETTNWWQYLLSQGEVILHYLRLSVWPHPLVLDYMWPPAWHVAQHFPDRLWIDVVVPVAVVLSLLAVSLFGLVRNTWWGFLGFAFFAVLSVTSSIIPIADLAVEHRMYVPLAAVLALLVGGGWRLLRRLPEANAARAVGGGAVGVAALALAILAVERNSEYATGVSIWSTVVERAPYNPRGYHNLGEALADAGRLPEAIDAYGTAIRINPSFQDSQHNLGQAFMDVGRPDLAAERFRDAVRLEPEEAESRYGFATALFALGRADEALLQAQEAIDREPDMARAHNLRGTILAQTGRPDEAIDAFRQAIAIDPGYAEAHYNLGLTFHHAGRYAEALPHYELAIDLAPETPRYLQSAARLLATAPDDAVRHAGKAVQMAAAASLLQNNTDIRTLDTLAAARAEAGQFDIAVSIMRHTIAMAERAGLPPPVVAEMRARLALYQRNEPYREAFPRSAEPAPATDAETPPDATAPAAP